MSILCLPRWFNNSINFKTYIEPAQPVHQSPATPPATAPAGPASSPAVAAFTKGATSFPPHNFPAAAPGGTLLTCVDSWYFWGSHTQVILGQILATQFLGIWNHTKQKTLLWLVICISMDQNISKPSCPGEHQTARQICQLNSGAWCPKISENQIPTEAPACQLATGRTGCRFGC